MCVDVIDLGLKPNPFKPGTVQPKIDIAWQIAERRDDGKRFVVYKRYTLSIAEKATLRHDLESWRGRAFTADEQKRFDVETVIGANALLNIQHKSAQDGSRVFANVIAVMPVLKGMTKLVPENYVRHQEDAPEEAPAVDPVTEDEIPF